MITTAQINFLAEFFETFNQQTGNKINFDEFIEDTNFEGDIISDLKKLLADFDQIIVLIRKYDNTKSIDELADEKRNLTYDLNFSNVYYSLSVTFEDFSDFVELFFKNVDMPATAQETEFDFLADLFKKVNKKNGNLVNLYAFKNFGYFGVFYESIEDVIENLNEAVEQFPEAVEELNEIDLDEDLNELAEDGNLVRFTTHIYTGGNHFYHLLNDLSGELKDFQRVTELLVQSLVEQKAPEVEPKGSITIEKVEELARFYSKHALNVPTDELSRHLTDFQTIVNKLRSDSSCLKDFEVVLKDLSADFRSLGKIEDSLVESMPPPRPPKLNNNDSEELRKKKLKARIIANVDKDITGTFYGVCIRERRFDQKLLETLISDVLAYRKFVKSDRDVRYAIRWCCFEADEMFRLNTKEGCEYWDCQWNLSEIENYTPELELQWETKWKPQLEYLATKF